jgi:hypothetical protein
VFELNDGLNTFVKITNEQVWKEIQEFRRENDLKHQEMIALMATDKACNNLEHSQMKGGIHLNYAICGGILAIVVGMALWVWQNMPKM